MTTEWSADSRPHWELPPPLFCKGTWEGKQRSLGKPSVYNVDLTLLKDLKKERDVVGKFYIAVKF